MASRPKSTFSPKERYQLDMLARHLVMLRANASVIENKKGSPSYHGKCQWCQNKRWLQWSHIHPRGKYPWLRWDPDNAVALCSGCHLFKWHRDPYAAERWIRTFLGEAKRDMLAQRSMVKVLVDYNETKHALETEIARREGRDA